MSKVVDYRVVCGENNFDVAEQVREWIKRGWEPQGGYDGQACTQALVKVEEDVVYQLAVVPAEEPVRFDGGYPDGVWRIPADFPLR